MEAERLAGSLTSDGNSDVSCSQLCPGRAAGYPAGLDRNAARACLRSTVSIVSTVSSFVANIHQTMHHVSASPRYYPGRSDFPSPVGDQSFLLFVLVTCN
jgi:hypothetical protein